VLAELIAYEVAADLDAEAVLPLGYRGRLLRVVAPYVDAHERDLNKKNQRRVIHGVLTPLDPSLTLTQMQHPAMLGKVQKSIWLS
jgi:hypothetical protein